jgi:arylformamidase
MFQAGSDKTKDEWVMRVIDLSHTIEPGMPAYPGTPEPQFRPLASIAEHGFAEQIMTISSHTGTHVDLPSHMLQTGKSLDAFSVERFAGKGYAIDLRSRPEGVITAEELYPFTDHVKESEFLLLCSGWSQYWGSPYYYEGYPVLSKEASLWLTSFHLKGLGVDMISVDAPDSDDFPVHNRLLQNGVLIIENLVGMIPLLHLSFIFCGFPLKIIGAEASPVRAVALVDDDEKA